MKYYKYIRIILILIPILILAVLVYKHICPGGVLKVDYDFCREDPFISEFSPMGRVLEIKKSRNQEIKKSVDQNYCYQEMVIDPVYFDVRLPHDFGRARLTVWYQKDSETSLKIGPRLNPDKWEWNLQDIQYVRTEEEWKVGIMEVDLTGVEMDNNRVRWLISSPGLDISGEKIFFKKIKIEFYEDGK